MKSAVTKLIKAARLGARFCIELRAAGLVKYTRTARQVVRNPVLAGLGRGTRVW